MRGLGAVAVVALLLGACSSAQETQTPTSQPSTSASQTQDPSSPAEPTSEPSDGEEIDSLPEGFVEHVDEESGLSLSVPGEWIDVIDEAVNVPNVVLVFADPERSQSIVVRALTPWNMIPAPGDIQDQLKSSIGTEQVEYLGEESINGYETWKFLVSTPEFTTVVYYMNIGGRAVEVTGNQYGGADVSQLEEMMSTVKESE